MRFFGYDSSFNVRCVWFVAKKSSDACLSGRERHFLASEPKVRRHRNAVLLVASEPGRLVRNMVSIGNELSALRQDGRSRP